MTERSSLPSDSPDAAASNLQPLSQNGLHPLDANPQAIAHGLNQKLQPYGITVKTQVKLHRLEVLLEGVPVPEQQLAIALVLGELVRLQLPTLETVRLLARQVGVPELAWTQTFDLQPTPAVASSSAPLAELRHRASQGDAGAMKTLIDRALDHKHITANITQASDRLQIDLVAERAPDQGSSVTLVCREVSHWLPLSLPLLCISGSHNPQLEPDWLQKISLESGSTPTLQQLALGLKAMPAKPSARPAPHPALCSPSQFPLPASPSLLKTIAASLLLSSLLLLSRQLSFLISPLLIMVHELGHASVAWLFGYGAIPAFDFIYGGGVTMQTLDRIPLLLFGLGSGFAYLCYRYRHNDLTSRVLLAGAIAYAICAFTPLHTLLIVGMGHGFELLFAGIFLYRALSGWGCRYAIERPLYGMLGFFMVFYDIRFAYGLLTDAEQRAIYEVGKGSIVDNDFVRLANEYFQVDLSAIVMGFLLCAIATPLITGLLFRYRVILLYGFSRLFLTLKD
ncbi:MAG TPA: hypothetical protein V6C57_08730 [Coleofasciculaceae cyanobacterium]